MRNLMINTTARIRQRGSVIIILAVSILAVMAFAALVVDLGAVHTARTQLKVATDAAALAAVQELGGDQVYATAAQFASLNSVLARPVTLSQEDIVTGHLDFATGAFTPDAEPPNAVRVTARRTPGSPDGPLDLFFAGVFGIDTVSLEAESVAALDGRVGGVEPAQTENELDLLPFAVDLDQVGHLEDLEGNAIDAVNFEIDYESGTVIVYEGVDLQVQVLGSQITYGAGGPTIPVYAWVSLNNGTSYDEINNGNAVSGGEELTYTGVEGVELAVKGQAKYRYHGCTLFDCTRYSNAGTPYVIVLTQGDVCPEYQGFDGQDEITEFLEPYMDPDTREMTIGENDVIFLFEYVDNLQSSASDFQDLVVLCTFTRIEAELDRSETRFVANVDQTIDFFPFDDMEAPGNFGLVSLDGHSNGTSVLRNWIDNGYPDTFSISSDPGYLLLNGCPGMHGGISNAIDARVGDTVLVTVYDNLTGQGNNATYRIPYFLAVEIVDVQLTGPPASRHIEAIIKGFHTTNLIIDPSAPEHSAIGINRLGG